LVAHCPGFFQNQNQNQNQNQGELEMKKYQVTLTGVTPLLLHRDNIKWGERVKAWTSDPNNKKKSVAGDDRTPAWTWIGYCYFASGQVVIDADNLMAMLRDAGKKCPAAKGKGSLKAATQSGIIVNEIGWPITVQNHTIPQKTIEACMDEEDFEKHELMAVSNDFELFVKRARVGTSKHVRVRPRFDVWSATGTITLLDDTLNKSIEMLFQQAGQFVGVGDWRPGSPASGRFGMFSAKLVEV
jgi:hypothetical protein